MTEYKPQRTRTYNFRQAKLAPHEPKPLGLNLSADKLDRAMEFGVGVERTAAVPVAHEKRGKLKTIKCMLCRSEFTNQLAMSWHEYCSHHDELVVVGMNWREYMESCRDGYAGRWSGGTDASA